MKCSLKLGEVPLHLYQITAGLKILADKGFLDLEIERLKRGDIDFLPYNMLRVIFNNKSIIFDMNDGYDNLLKEGESYVDFYNEILKDCDLFFKRSFNEQLNASLNGADKIRKTAPNFFVTVPGNPAHSLRSDDPPKEKLKKAIRALPHNKHSNNLFFEESFTSFEKNSKNPNIIFFTRLWDPKGDYKGQLTQEKKEERHRINERRINCIRLGKKEFGNSFLAGLVANPYATKNYPDLLVKDGNLTVKSNYMEMVKKADIAVATAGLHRSTGWKFAEYLAASKAIVTEALFYSSHGDLRKGKNYLEFEDEYEFCQRISSLFEAEKRYQMMKANREYYDEYMRCEKILLHAFEETEG